MNSEELHEARLERLRSSTMFYQFQPVNIPDDDRIAKLSTTKLFMSDPEKFNDPSDLRLEIKDLTDRIPFLDEERLRKAMNCLLADNTKVEKYWFYDNQLITSLKNWIAGAHNSQLINDVRRRFSSFGVTCFVPEWRNKLMWSHYATKHAGFCVEYSVKPCSLATENPEFFQYDVQYVSKLPKLCLSEILFSPHQTVGRMLATKATEWAYEKEWRLVHSEKKGASVNMPKYMEISALIAGQKMDSVLLDHLKTKATELGVPVYQAKPKYGELTLDPIK